MQPMGSEPEQAYVRAPRWRETGAGLVDAAAFGGLTWLARRRELIRLDGAVGTVIGVASVVLREQLRTPGQVLLGIRTVDRRTGERVALWRTLAVAATNFAGRRLAGRLAASSMSGPKGERERRTSSGRCTS